MAQRPERIALTMLRTLEIPPNMDPNHPIPGELFFNAAIRSLEDEIKGTLVLFSPMKYIDRLEVELGTPKKSAEFHRICVMLRQWGHFMAENVRWKRFDTHLAVTGATFVRFTEVKE